jgi:cytidylate kinase
VRAGAPLVVAIDGPSGVGKSTVARRVAERLGIPFLDTGAMYRAIGLEVLDRGVDPLDREAVERLAQQADIRLERRPDGAFEVLLGGVPVEPRIRAPEVGEVSSTVSAHPGVRRRLVGLQRAAAERFGGVLEGRDIGTHVVPDTPFKFFLDADAAMRFRRRHAELAAAGRQVPFEQVVDEITRRDHRDTTRADSPLTRDPSYTFVDSTHLSIDDVADRIASDVQARQRA